MSTNETAPPFLSDDLREKCAVFGAWFPEQAAAPYAYLGLLALQHRGQEGAGIAAFADGQVTSHKGAGLASQVFTPEHMARLHGNIAVGHVRYATMGSVNDANLQPVLAPSRWGEIALAHNGNLVNAPALRDKLHRQGRAFSGTSDTAVMTHVVATALDETAVEATAYAMRQCQGAFSVVAAVGDQLLAFRDALGIRPLALGRLESGWVVASETCAFDHIGATYVRDVAAGELVVIDSRGVTNHQVLRASRTAHCIFEYVYFARPDSNIAGRNVHLARARMGAQLAKEHPVSADLVVPVPDSGNSAALGFAKASGLPLEFGLVKNRYMGRSFIQPDQVARDLAVRLKLNPVRQLLEGKRVVLVDDSIVRGTTSGKIVAMLRSVGAKEVHLRISSPPIRWPCFYGVDIATRTQLVAAELDVEGIRELVGADSLGYMSLEGLIEAVGLDKAALCRACLENDLYFLASQLQSISS